MFFLIIACFSKSIKQINQETYNLLKDKEQFTNSQCIDHNIENFFNDCTKKNKWVSTGGHNTFFECSDEVTEGLMLSSYKSIKHIKSWTRFELLCDDEDLKLKLFKFKHTF